MIYASDTAQWIAHTYSPVLVDAPTIKPVTLAEAKVQCRANDFTDDDVKIGMLIDAATSYLDGWTGILGSALCEQTWRQDFDGLSNGSGYGLPSGELRFLAYGSCLSLRLPLFPVISIAGVTYRDPSGAQQTIDPTNYSLQTDDLGSYVRFISTYASPSLFIEPPRASVTYKAGYANVGSDPDFTSTVPDALRHAILMLVAHWYDNREAVVVGQRAQAIVLPLAVDALIAPFRRVKF